MYKLRASVSEVINTTKSLFLRSLLLLHKNEELSLSPSIRDSFRTLPFCMP